MLDVLSLSYVVLDVLIIKYKKYFSMLGNYIKNFKNNNLEKQFFLHI